MPDNPLFNKAYGFSHGSPTFTYVFAANETGDSGQEGVWRPLKPTDFVTVDGGIEVNTDTLEENVDTTNEILRASQFVNGTDGRTWGEKVYDGAIRDFTFGGNGTVETIVNTNDAISYYSTAVALASYFNPTGTLAEAIIHYNSNLNEDYSQDAILMFNGPSDIILSSETPFTSGIRLSCGDSVSLTPEEYYAAGIHSEPRPSKVGNACYFSVSLYYKK